MSQQPDQKEPESEPEREDTAAPVRFKGPGQWRSQAVAVQEPHDEPEDTEDIGPDGGDGTITAQLDGR